MQFSSVYGGKLQCAAHQVRIDRHSSHGEREVLSDFEERLRQALDNEASKVTPDPNTWRQVEARALRARTRGRALTAVGTAMIGLVVLLVASQMVGSGDIPRATAPTPTSETLQAAAPERAGAEAPASDAKLFDAAPSAGPCAARGGAVAVVATTLGRLDASCAGGGTEALTSGPDLDAHPVVAGGRVLFDRRSAPGERSRLMELDLATGHVAELRPGAWPAVGPDGQVAAIVDTPGDGRQPEIEVVTGSVTFRFPVYKPAAEEFSARHLVFDPAGDRLYWEAGYEGSTVWSATLEGRELVQLEDAGTPDATLAAPASADSGTVTAISRCCRATEGDRPTSAHLITQNSRGIVEEADLAGLEGFDPGAPELFVSPGGQMTLDAQDRWQPAAGPTWIVGDGERLFVVGDRDPATLLCSGCASAAVVPHALPLDGRT